MVEFVEFVLAYASDAEAAEPALAGFREFAEPVADMVAPMPYVALQQMLEMPLIHGYLFPTVYDTPAWQQLKPGGISSLASKNAFVNGAAYCASKSALNAFSEAMMQEVRYDGVRVAYVLPG